MNDAVRRALRTWLQAFLGSIITSGVLSGLEADGVVDWDIAQKALVSAIAAGVIALITWVQNVLEDNTSFPALLKAPASEGENPVPNDAGYVSAGWVTAVASVAMLALLVCWAWDLGPFAP